MSLFLNAIKGTSSGAAGTGAFTPAAAASGFMPWSDVPVGWIGLVRYEDGAAWELRYGFWNGTTISRPSNVVGSSTGSALTLSSSATAALVADARKLMPASGGERVCVFTPTPSSAAFQATGTSTTIPIAGSASSQAQAYTNVLTEAVKITYTGNTTGNAAAGPRFDNLGRFSTSNLGRGSAEFQTRFGTTQIPSGARMLVALGDDTMSMSSMTEQPSALLYVNYFGIVMDTTDTTLQFCMGQRKISGAGGVKVDTGIPLVVNAWYEAHCTAQPGRFTCLLIRVDTGDIFYGTTAGQAYTGPQGNNNASMSHFLSTSTVTGTAAIWHVGETYMRIGI